MKKWMAVLLLGLCITLTAQAKPAWHLWLKEFKQEAVANGIDPRFFDRVFVGVKPSRRVMNFDRRQPEKRLTFRKYRRTRADAYRIKLGKREYRRHKRLLNQIGGRFGVDPCFITALWGIESSYGRYMGNFPVIKSLATLAYDDRRSKFFRRELHYALHILQGGHVSMSDFKGEWAGASGQSQFLPSSWYNYAVDYNQDGRKDIWSTYGDIFASIANYLKRHGWQANQPWSIQVTLPANFNDRYEGLKVKFPISEWQKMGVKPAPGFHFPDARLVASVVKPYGGPVFMAFNNYKVIMKYNHSIYYAATVGYMADKICGRV